jgi:hypothetical protein
VKLRSRAIDRIEAASGEAPNAAASFHRSVLDDRSGLTRIRCASGCATEVQARGDVPLSCALKMSLRTRSYDLDREHARSGMDRCRCLRRTQYFRRKPQSRASPMGRSSLGDRLNGRMSEKSHSNWVSGAKRNGRTLRPFLGTPLRESTEARPTGPRGDLLGGNWR